jgi:hypothetical protein
LKYDWTKTIPKDKDHISRERQAVAKDHAKDKDGIKASTRQRPRRKQSQRQHQGKDTKAITWQRQEQAKDKTKDTRQYKTKDNVKTKTNTIIRQRQG